jgi:uncharacterized protein (DUF1778 family)
MAALERTEKFQLRLTQEERRMLDALADEEGLSSSDLVRQMIRQRFGAVFAASRFTEEAVEKLLKPTRDATKLAHQIKKTVEPIKRARVKK